MHKRIDKECKKRDTYFNKILREETNEEKSNSYRFALKYVGEL